MASVPLTSMAMAVKPTKSYVAYCRELFSSVDGVVESVAVAYMVVSSTPGSWVTVVIYNGSAEFFKRWRGFLRSRGPETVECNICSGQVQPYCLSCIRWWYRSVPSWC